MSSDVSLSSDFSNPSAVPYFLWDEPMSVLELKEKLSGADPAERSRLLAKMLREARDTDVWEFTTPDEVTRNWGLIRAHLGRRRGFWEFLLRQWRAQGLNE
jgi:hypothetical protein